MAENSKIEWTDHTFNPWRGCTKVHEGCAHCYAEREAKRFPDNRGIWGPNGTRVVASEAMWRQPLKWNKKAACISTFDCANNDHADCCPQKNRPRVFCASLADVFEDWQGQPVTADGSPVIHKFSEEPYTLANARRDLFSLIDMTPHLDWLLLTKRPENIAKMWLNVDSPNGFPMRPNTWLGTSVSTQEHADKQIPELLKCRDLSPVLFLSIEPLLGPIDLRRIYARESWMNLNALEKLRWVIVGGESGPNARPMHPDWVRSIRDQCIAADVPFFFKQWGEWMPVFHGIDPNKGDLNCRIKAATKIGDQAFWNVGKKAAGRLLDGREWSQFPEVAHG